MANNCHKHIYKDYIQIYEVLHIINLCLILTFGKFSCKNTSITDTFSGYVGHLYTFLFCQRLVNMQLNIL